MEKKEKEVFYKSSWFKTILIFVIVFVISFGAFRLTIMPTFVDGNSMYPTLSHLDYAISDRVFYKIDGLDRFDIITFTYKKSTLVKRVIALEGEHIVYKDGVLTIDDKVVEENFISNSAKLATTEDYGDIDLVVPKGEVFVMGDNRYSGKSMDSRFFGPIEEEKIKSVGILKIGKCKTIKNDRCSGISFKWPKKVK